MSTVSFLLSGSVVGKINSVDVNPCPTEPCQLKKNTNVTISIDFLPSKYAMHFKAVISFCFYTWTYTSLKTYLK